MKARPGIQIRDEWFPPGDSSAPAACPQLRTGRSFAQVAPPGVPPFSSSCPAYPRPWRYRHVVPAVSLARYTLPEMGRVWSEEHKFKLWLDVELAVCRARAATGEIPPEAMHDISARPSTSSESTNSRKSRSTT